MSSPSHYQSLAWSLLKSEQIVCGDTVFFVSGDTWVERSAPSGNHDTVGCDSFLGTAIVQHDGVVVYERSIGIEVSDFAVFKNILIFLIDSLDVLLEVINHYFPVHFLYFAVWNACLNLVISEFIHDGSVMEKFLGDAAHIYARSTEVPGISFRGWLHKIGNAHFHTLASGFSTQSDTSSASAYHEEVVVID